ncbi:quaternary amine ABC transporter ATP-binding protein [Calothrix rhizosoleniae]|uniref:quaternary amine ABC transporter ATP-binding protein n=1 Tax=Calothrix rhizosoleniae TaxID=888997 RepID=UPI000B4A3203|nr:glycine betaine/L-proline ABC transporter ATP-binding protein [Calothrix rhizosoleniae]
MKNPEPKIVIEHLIKIYGEKPHAALQLFRSGGTRDSILKETGNVLGIADASFTINQGELFVIMGLSGSGKSTLVRCINRLINPTSGCIYIDGEDIAHVDERRMRAIRLTKVSMVFQKFGLLPHRTVSENVEYGLKVKGIDKAKRRQKALETLKIVGLGEWADYLPSSLSGGMQQRVGLARALATDADILLMDEAFSALDPLIRREMQDELLRLQKELHKTIVFISHDIQEALKIGDRIAVMKDGAIVQIGTPEEIITQPADDYISAFTEDVNRAQVLTTESIIRPTIPVILEQDSPSVALGKMSDNVLKHMCVVDTHGKPVGMINKQGLELALENGKADISQLMQTDFPQAKTDTSLEDTFPLYQKGLPVTIVDGEGKFQGLLELADVLASISNGNN